ncbi:MAG TPA: phospholipase D-like domain-containing protein [Herpetosiphonaceae bacterium]
MRRLLAITALLLAIAACASPATASLSPAASATNRAALGAGVTEVAVFNDPYIDQTNWDDYTIHNRIRSMIRSTPAGQSIHAAIHSLTIPGVTDDLIAAHTNGVNVYVVHSGHDDGAEGQRLAAALGSRYVHCRGSSADVEACISNRSSSLMHSKFFLFSQTVDAGVTKTNVVAVTSANMTYSQADLYNNLVIIAGDSTTYTGYKSVFNDMFYLRKNNNYQAAPNGYFTSPNAGVTSYFSPRADSNGGTSEEAATDTVANTMTYLSGGSGCYLKAAQAMFTSGRDPIASELIRIRRLGCTVQLAYSNIDPAVKDRLKAAGVQLRLVETAHANSSVVTKVHSKYYIMYGTYNGSTNAYRLFTGSHNWSGSALRLNDEVLLKLYDQAMINSFISNFNMIWSRGVAQ